MNTKEMEGLRATLLRRLSELRRDLGHEAAGGSPERYRDIAGETPDSADEAVADEITAVGNAIVGRHVEELRDIEAALARMDAGQYGVCVDCGIEVDPARLAVYPTAKRCRPCQSLREKKFAVPPHASL